MPRCCKKNEQESRREVPKAVTGAESSAKTCEKGKVYGECSPEQIRICHGGDKHPCQ